MCTTFIAKLVLGLVNTVVLLVGLTMFIVGLLIHTQPALSKEALSALLQKLEDSASKAGVDIDTSDFSVADVAYSFTIAIIVFGLFLTAVSILAFVGIKYSLKPVLIVYFFITLVLFLIQLTLLLIAVIDRGVYDDAVKPRLKTTIEDEFAGLNSTDPVSQIWNGIMIHLQCCGVDDYEDFSAASKWDRELAGDTGLVTPVACCKTIPDNPPFTCAKNPLDENLNNYNTGCYTKIWDYLINNSGIVIGIAAGVLSAQLVLLLLTCIVMNSMGKVSDIV